MDLKSAYWNVFLKDKSASVCRLILRVKPGTDQVTFGENKPGEYVEYISRVLSFGVCQASAILRTVVIIAANDFLEPNSTEKLALCCYAYVDDVLAGGHTLKSREKMKTAISALFTKIGWATHPWIDSEQVMHKTSFFNPENLVCIY